jgi:DNA replication and repair protein RecF
MRQLHEGRERDRQAARALIGPHRADIEVRHGPKNAPAKICSTGEQKALLVGLVLAQARLSKLRNEGIAPLLLLDEIAAHFDKERRLGLFEALCRLGAQTWMTGTEQESFQGAKELLRAQIFLVAGNAFHRQNDAESGFNPQI